MLNILSTGLLNIRAYGNGAMAAECAAEADHLHNLPDLVRKPTTELLSFYLHRSKPHYERQVKDTRGFANDWKRLEDLLLEQQ